MLRRTLLIHLFNLLYTHLAWAYDIAGWLASGGLWYRWVEQLLPFIDAGPVLEVGVGRGRLLGPIASGGISVVGVDYSAQMARYAARESGQPVVRADGRHLPFPGGYFATVVTSFPAPYIMEARTQREFARVVRPGGQWLWLDAPHFDPITSMLPFRLLTRLAWGPTATATEALNRPLRRDLSGGYWQVHLQQLTVGPSRVTLRRATLQPPA